MSRTHSEHRETSRSDGAIAAIWLVLYAIGFLDILLFKQAPKTEVVLAKPAIHTLAVMNHPE